MNVQKTTTDLITGLMAIYYFYAGEKKFPITKRYFGLNIEHIINYRYIEENNQLNHYYEKLFFNSVYDGDHVANEHMRSKSGYRKKTGSVNV